MGFFRYHQRNLAKIFVVDFLEKDLENPGDDLSDRDYARSMYIMEIQDLLSQMEFILSKIYKFETSFFATDITLINKNDLKYYLIYRLDDVIEKSSKGIVENTTFPIQNEKDTLFKNYTLDEIRVN